MRFTKSVSHVHTYLGPAVEAADHQRDWLAPQVELEASGGISLSTIADIARTGIDRISAGALTHSAQWLDVGLDWD